MKQKKQPDVFDTLCWRYEVITDPQQVIAELFTQAGMEHFRSFVGKVCFYAAEERIIKSRSPLDVLLYMKSIRSLIKAAAALQKQKNSVVSVNTTDLFNRKYFCRHNNDATAWTAFPRFLSAKEYCNPYRVFRKFFKYLPLEDWLRNWEELVEAALSRSNGDVELNITGIYRMLVKLLEAAHLVDVREVMHVGGYLKTRF